MFAATALTPVISFAESASTEINEQTMIEEVKALEDPTILKRRIWAETEWNKYRDGIHDIEETFGTFWAWRVSDTQDWAVRLKVPFKFHIAGDAAGDSDKQGLSDIKLATGTAFRFSTSLRTGGGVEMRFPSGTDGLSNNVWKLQLFWSVAWDVTRQLTLNPSFEYNKSVAEKQNAMPQHFMEMFFPAIYLLPRYWSITTRYEAKVDFEKEGHWTHSAKLAIGKLLKGVPLGFSLSIKKPFDGGNKHFQVNFITTYYFPSQ